MDEIVRQAVARAIVTMRDRLGERLTIDDLARAAMFSKFHFTRVFLRTTGLSPGRFLSAMRLAEAKRLLTTTTISVADISHQVGYNSVGTFSARFSGSVGVSPSGYRQLRGASPRIAERPDHRLPGATVRGQLHAMPPAEVGPVFVGLFPARIAEGLPARHTLVPGPGPYTLADVPPGSWYLITHAYGASPLDQYGQRPFTGLTGPVTIQVGVTARLADVRLRPRRGFDPPVLLALPDLRKAVAAHAVAV
ncbi:helix-turn-helix transcriptional regulator [Amycolatopsis sp., V23-08]|uniref:Helix-turn-helix transcriptional regulator n=1 Tax=Amycolatopsis heterodermiae TaxID=3110235 RepID=A0ABU5RLA1_9PSEU|nr:helix-turn-helix transcriptional regulator [Amycolatopsis sp., V23-08]MEA5366978.1 helix-turn-helix transcriptional regulator [Amycolatopsis sp., V23-08]